MAMIEISELTKYYGKYMSIENVTFEVKKGEIFGIVGGEGAGKSTILKIMMNLVKPTRGTAMVCGMDCQKYAREVKKNVGYVPEDAMLYQKLSARSVLKFAEGFATEPARERSLRWCSEFGIEPGDAIRKLSDEKKRALYVIQALMAQPRILLLDNPFSEGNAEFSQKLCDLLRRENKRGLTVLVTAREAGCLRDLCTQMRVMQEGTLLPGSAVPAGDAQAAEPSLKFRRPQAAAPQIVQRTLEASAPREDAADDVREDGDLPQDMRAEAQASREGGVAFNFREQPEDGADPDATFRDAFDGFSSEASGAPYPGEDAGDLQDAPGAPGDWISDGPEEPPYGGVPAGEPQDEPGGYAPRHAASRDGYANDAPGWDAPRDPSPYARAARGSEPQQARPRLFVDMPDTIGVTSNDLIYGRRSGRGDEAPQRGAEDYGRGRDAYAPPYGDRYADARDGAAPYEARRAQNGYADEAFRRAERAPLREDDAPYDASSRRIGAHERVTRSSDNAVSAPGKHAARRAARNDDYGRGEEAYAGRPRRADDGPDGLYARRYDARDDRDAYADRQTRYAQPREKARYDSAVSGEIGWERPAQTSADVKRISLMAEGVPVSLLKRMGAMDVRQRGDRYEFRYEGELDRLIIALSQMHVRDLRISSGASSYED